MRLGFVSAILPDYHAGAGLPLCARGGIFERRADVLAARQVRAPICRSDSCRRHQPLDWTRSRKSRTSSGDPPGAISGLGYYPNPLSADRAEAEVVRRTSRRVIDAAAALGVGVVNTFVGRDPALSVDANWPRFSKSGSPLIAHAESQRRQDRHRELPDALHRRRMARRQEPGDDARRSGGGCSTTSPARTSA